MNSPLPAEKGRFVATGMAGYFLVSLSAQFPSANIADVQGGLFSTPDKASWVLTVYTMASFAGIVTSGILIRTLSIGRYLVASASVFATTALACATAPDISYPSVDPRGHFVAEGMINGNPVRLLVDTGASMIALPGRDALRLGIDYRKGERGITQTANGPVTAYRIRLDSVKIGAIDLNNVEAIVIEQGLDIALLGMSFLNRVEMKRDGRIMTLIRRF